MKNIPIRGDQYLIDLFQSQFGQPVHQWNSVCWFHLTRVPTTTNFAEGILPLQDALTKIWRTVISAQSQNQKKRVLKRLRDQGVPDFQYQHKTKDPQLGGPYAMLVKESAFRTSEIGNHDYLRTPEIIEDICNGYEKETGERIFDEIAALLRPCIVKFEHDSDHGDRHLTGVLLYYCWSKCRNERLCYLANTCFDGQGKTIPRSAIRAIEFV